MALGLEEALVKDCGFAVGAGCGGLGYGKTSVGGGGIQTGLVWGLASTALDRFLQRP
ncbi:MAG: hypothetical protein ACO3GL_01345 [Bacteroidia bacterium]